MDADSYVFAESKLDWKTTQNIKTPNVFSSFPKVPVAAECHWRAQANWRAHPPYVVGHQAAQKLLTHETVTSGCEILRKRHLNQICIPLLFWYQNNCNSGLK